MQNVFDAVADPAVVLDAANEEFPVTQAHTPAPPGDAAHRLHGWSAYEIWHTRIRPRPGITSLFLPQS